MVSNQGRQEGAIDPEEGPVARFALALRRLREECGRPTYRQLATLSAKVGTPYSDTTFSTAARGHAPPSRAVTFAYVRACLAHTKAEERRTAGAVREWDARWRALEEEVAPAEDGVPERPVEGYAEVATPASNSLEGPGVDAPAAPAAPEPEAASAPGTEVPPSTSRAAPGSSASDHPPATPTSRFTPRRRRTLALLAAGAALVGVGFGARYIAPAGSAAVDALTGTVTTDAAPPVPPATAGGNSRCARPRYVNGLTWTPCTRVERGRLLFLVRLSNPGSEPVTVRAKLAYVRAGAGHGCPGAWGSGVRVGVRPGGTVTSPRTACAVDRLPATAFQAKAWVTEPAAPAWGYREMSPTVHIQPDRTKAIWADEA
ncbi:hypothetical protein EES39_39610 [Streptomyces sp. ADI92-24]|uniref:hypothetical protein n=1 Tax=Streptomyces sp. ADI92-24 TaxID=1522756 RepID=UPI000F555405|nr:hypothetical protein [Streptomyces sp. ADI92-24]RPK32037.1 hypothetical protein EES39_39610 [Streptomyces sp. ADI92-24]